jgi:hypothetical protein
VKVNSHLVALALRGHFLQKNFEREKRDVKTRYRMIDRKIYATLFSISDIELRILMKI